MTASFDVYDDFPLYKEGVYRVTDGAHLLGGHAVQGEIWTLKSFDCSFGLKNCFSSLWIRTTRGWYPVLEGEKQLEYGLVSAIHSGTFFNWNCSMNKVQFVKNDPMMIMLFCYFTGETRASSTSRSQQVEFTKASPAAFLNRWKPSDHRLFWIFRTNDHWWARRLSNDWKPFAAYQRRNKSQSQRRTGPYRRSSSLILWSRGRTI